MQNKNIFIHIPKTGGTTINTAMNDSNWQTEVGFNYRHIQKETKRSNTAEIFETSNFDKFKDCNIFMMLRDPIDRLISEYYFLKERKEYIKLLGKEPKNFEEFVNNPRTFNYTIGFLVGKRLYDIDPVTNDDLNKVINAIEKLPIHVGIFEQFPESMAYFTEKTGIQWKENIVAKRMTFERPKKEDISQELQQKILLNNSLDKKLYDYCLSKFNKEKPKKVKNQITFELSKYNHVVPYAQTFVFYEFCISNKNYIKNNMRFFQELSRFLLLNLNIRDGHEFTATWNATYLEAVSYHFPNSEFYNELKTALQQDQDFLASAINIGKSIDQFFEHKGKSADRYYKAMKFDVQFVKRLRIVNKEKANEPPMKKSFFSKLFSK